MFLIPKLGFFLIGFCLRYFNIGLRFFSKKMILEEVEFSLVHSKHSSSIWIPLKSRFIFKLNPEKSWDKFLKSLGLSQEFQTGDKEFDERIYMASDSLSLNKHIAADEDLKKLVMDLSKMGFYQIIVDGKYFKIKFSKEHSFDNTYLSKGVKIFKQIRDIEKKWHGHFHDSFAWKFIVTESLLWAIAAYGLVSFMEHTSIEVNKPIDVYPIINEGLIFGGIAAIISIFLVVLNFRGSSRSHRIIIESIVLILLGIPASSIALLNDLNMHFDHQKTMRVELLIENKVIYETRRRGSSTTHYKFELEQKNNYRFYQLPKTLEVNSEIYHQAEVGQYLLVEIAPGRFKFPWLKSMKVNPISSVSKSKQ